MKPLNVLYLIRTWDLGGSHTIIRLLLKHMPRDRFNIITVPYDAPGDGDQRFVDAVRNDGQDVAPERIPWHSRKDWFRARRTIRDLVDRYEIDLIHAHDTISNVLVGIGRGGYPCACVGSPYGWWEDPWHFEARINHWIERNLALPHFDRVYTVSEDMKAKVMRGPTKADRIRVIHTGIDLANVDGGANRDAVRTELGIPPEAVVVGTVSRLFKEKGHTYLLDAAAKLASTLPELHLLIVGTGDEREPLEQQAAGCGIADRVHFTGYYADLAGALRAMDIFAQPSIDHEGFPTAVLEAQAAGLPVVASDIGGTHETMDVGTTGILVKPADADDLARGIETLVADPEKRAAMAAAGRSWIEDSFTLPDMIAKMGATYDEACAHHRGERRGA